MLALNSLGAEQRPNGSDRYSETLVAWSVADLMFGRDGWS